jgi:hypothetical protein
MPRSTYLFQQVPRGVVVHGVSGETIKTGENQDERDKKDAA